MTFLIHRSSVFDLATRGSERVPGMSSAPGFALALAQARAAQDSAGTRLTAQPGDTLVGMARGYLTRMGAAVDERQTLQLARQVAAANGIANPDMIRAGQVIDFASLNTASEAGRGRMAARGDVIAAVPGRAPAVGAPGALSTRPPMPSARAALAVRGNLVASGSSHPVLDRTLRRAVDKGYIPATDLTAVTNRIHEMARTYNFSPDDFARVTLMESDGMNPRATNGNCHGIIQFCEGPNRGAASVDMAGRARGILDLSVLRQLDLAERYFQDAGLRPHGPRNGLDDLYLTVLTPAARAQKDPGQALNVAGPQAAALHLGGDQAAPITRTSLTQGLLRNAADRLARHLGLPAVNVPAVDRPAIAAASGDSWPARTLVRLQAVEEEAFSAVE